MWLNDCERTLRACSLTCRAWRRKAQTQLFTDHIFLHRIIIQRFFRAATARPALFTMVKNVVLCGSQFEIPAVAEAFEKRAWPLDSLLTFVLMFARKLKGLERLCITRGEWKTNRPLPLGNALYQGLSTFNSLSTLVLRNLILPSAHEFKEIILAIACLTRLECQTIFWKKVGVIGPADIQARHPTLRTLHINSYAPVKLDGEGSMYAFIKDITRVLTLITPDGQITELAANLRSFREYKLHECSDPNHLNTRHTFTIHDLGGSGISQLLRHAGTALRSLRLQLTGWRYSRVEEKEMTGAVGEFTTLSWRYLYSNNRATYQQRNISNSLTAIQTWSLLK
ncbi:uncharacterized protein B0H18DRAFT_671306 [Fomitopsis serialis]|uniref:uncharacterized protein n=1 Tax=Fomitopsis serialis TaxID=139415 RepID=UPI002008127F|nr:uncharacterized protein B0H18DRAFT_671306 [Neoantrodia serialis]KAH9932908.1 hypothetical protein B0H18DRAFT_671306 [Neoantrodia serialis]